MAKKKLKFEEALARLEEIVEAIEQGEVGLEESIKKYEEGMGLIQHCRKVLAESELKIQKLQPGEDGELSSTAFEPPVEEDETVGEG